MVSLRQNPSHLLLIPIMKLVLDPHFTFTLSNEIQKVVLVTSYLVLLAKYEFRCLQHGLHPFHDVVSELLVVIMGVLAFTSQLFGQIILHHTCLENLNFA